jgi:hypothetical protein
MARLSYGMRKLLLAAVLILAATPALAVCPVIPDDESTHNIQNQTRLTLCRQAEVNALAARKSQELQLQADLFAQMQNFELELRMQQMFAATQQTFPSPTFP